MKKIKLMKTVVAITLVFSALFCSSGATDLQAQPRWTHIVYITGNLDISSSGIATAYGSGSALSTQVKKCKITVELQQFKNNKWNTLYTWDTTSSSFSVATLTKSYAVYHGYSYQLKITLEVYKNNTLLETGTKMISYGYFA